MNRVSLAGAAFLGLIVCTGANAAPGSTVADTRTVTPVPLPGALPSAGFDDMRFASRLDRILMPGGNSGRLYAINPIDNSVSTLARVTAPTKPRGRHDAGTTSATFTHGYFIASDHATQSLAIVKAATDKIVEHLRLASGSDYVRYVKPLHQVWVTEPEAQQIEVFDAAFSATPPKFKRTDTIAIPGGPESLVIDVQRDRAYTNLWKSHTLAIDLRSQKIAARWANTCHHSHGLALAKKAGLLFVGCGEGKVVALNLTRHGAIASTAKTGAGVDIIAWNPTLRHLYVPGARSATLTILALDPKDEHLHTLATVPTASGAHCVATDGRMKAYVCDPLHARVLAVKDVP